MKRGMPQLSIYPEDKAERLAKIVGEQSAVAGALRELKRRRANGEDVVLMIGGSMIFVEPRPQFSF